MDEKLKGLIESAGAMAEMMRIFYDAFREVNFTDAQAMCFCAKIVKSMLDAAFNREDENEDEESEEDD